MKHKEKTATPIVANHVTITHITMGDNFKLNGETYRPVLNSNKENGEFLAFKTGSGLMQISSEKLFYSKLVDVNRLEGNRGHVRKVK